MTEICSYGKMMFPGMVRSFSAYFHISCYFTQASTGLAPEPTFIELLASIVIKSRENDLDLGKCQTRPELGRLFEVLKACSKFNIRNCNDFLFAAGKVEFPE